MFELPRRGSGADGLSAFSQELARISNAIGFKQSARGWCYQLEGFGLITKAEFDRVESLVNRCRQEGYLPIDFTAEEEGRRFSGVEIPQDISPIEFLGDILRTSLICEDYYTPDWWDGEDYYIQMIVEKIDLKTLFGSVCQDYHIPIATSKGWSSMLQRAEYAKRFRQAEGKGLTCVLLYCGDFDPDGLRISEFLRKNLEDLQYITWEDGTEGYDPVDLEIKRFGLNYDFIVANKLSWIENLITGSKKDLASPTHPNHFMPYVQDYIATYGVRKCEANALVVRPREAERLVRRAIEGYLGDDAMERFADKRKVVRDEIDRFRNESGVGQVIEKVIAKIQDNQ